MCIGASRVTNPLYYSSPMPAPRAFRPRSLRQARSLNTESSLLNQTTKERQWQALMPSNEKQEAAKTIVSRRFFLAPRSAALSAVSLTGNMEGQMTQTKTELWNRTLNGRVAVVTGA